MADRSPSDSGPDLPERRPVRWLRLLKLLLTVLVLAATLWHALVGGAGPLPYLP